MLKPAVLYKEEIEKKFAEFLYTENYFFYTGYACGNELPTIKAADDYFQYAIVKDNTVTGYFAYHIDQANDIVDRFGLFSFLSENNYTLAKDVYTKLEELIAVHRRVEWRVIGGNPVIRSYDALCKKYGGNKVTLHAVTKDLNGNWRDESIYEILNTSFKYRKGRNTLMHKVKNAEFEEYRKYREAVQQGKVLTPDGVRIICQANDKDPEKIGKYMLEMYNKFKSEGLVK